MTRKFIFWSTSFLPFYKKIYEKLIVNKLAGKIKKTIAETNLNLKLQT
jgi:hypothetical protein